MSDGARETSSFHQQPVSIIMNVGRNFTDLFRALGLLSARYAWKWVKETDPNGRLQMPGSRVMTPGKPDAPRWYWANTRSDACPQGFNTEETIKELWGTR